MIFLSDSLSYARRPDQTKVEHHIYSNSFLEKFTFETRSGQSKMIHGCTLYNCIILTTIKVQYTLDSEVFTEKCATNVQWFTHTSSCEAWLKMAALYFQI